MPTRRDAFVTEHSGGAAFQSASATLKETSR